VAVALVATLVRIPTLLAGRHLSFDDGVYGASAIAMRHGGVPFDGVFSSQGPLYLPLVFLGDLLGFRTLNSPRVLAVLSGALIAGFVAAIAGQLDRDASSTRARVAAVAAGLFAATSGALWWTTGPLTSDGPTIALSCAAVWFAFANVRRPARWRVVIIGTLLGAAVAVKLVMAAPAILVCALLLLATRRIRTALIAVIPLLLVPVVLTVAFGAGRVWEQVVSYHLESHVGSRNPATHLAKLFSTLIDRDLLLTTATVVGLVALTLIAIRARRTRSSRGGADWLTRATSGLTPIGLWLLVTIGVLAVQMPLWRNHVAYVIPPMAIIVGTMISRGGLPSLAIVTASLLILPHQFFQTRAMWDPEPYRGTDAAIARALRALPPGAQVISDDPGFAWRTDRRTPSNFVDTSVLRITSPIPGVVIGSATVINAATTPQVCAVVITSPERFGALPALGHLLAGSGYELDVEAPNAEVWIKQECRPNARARR